MLHLLPCSFKVCVHGLLSVTPRALCCAPLRVLQLLLRPPADVDEDALLLGELPEPVDYTDTFVGSQVWRHACSGKWALGAHSYLAFGESTQASLLVDDQLSVASIRRHLTLVRGVVVVVVARFRR